MKIDGITKEWTAAEAAKVIACGGTIELEYDGELCTITNRGASAQYATELRFGGSGSIAIYYEDGKARITHSSSSSQGQGSSGDARRMAAMFTFAAELADALEAL